MSEEISLKDIEKLAETICPIWKKELERLEEAIDRLNTTISKLGE